MIRTIFPLSKTDLYFIPGFINHNIDSFGSRKPISCVRQVILSKLRAHGDAIYVASDGLLTAGNIYSNTCLLV